jgi:hypothetical protein
MVLHQLAEVMVNNHDTRWKLHTDTVGAKQIKEFVKIHTTELFLHKLSELNDWTARLRPRSHYNPLKCWELFAQQQGINIPEE